MIMLSASITSNYDIGDVATEERSLWAAVLKQAIDDAETLTQQVQNDPSLWADPEFRMEVALLQQYFQNQSMEHGGFGFICDLLELNPNQAAQRINEKYLRYLIPVKERHTRTVRLAAV